MAQGYVKFPSEAWPTKKLLTWNFTLWASFACDTCIVSFGSILRVSDLRLDGNSPLSLIIGQITTDPRINLLGTGWHGITPSDRPHASSECTAMQYIGRGTPM